MSKLAGKQLVECKASSDVAYFVIDPTHVPQGVVQVEVMDADSCNSSDALPLTVAQLLPSQAIKLARALLSAAGYNGREVRAVSHGRVVTAQEFVFID